MIWSTLARSLALASPSPRLWHNPSRPFRLPPSVSALTDARPRDAAAMLGHWHRIEGPVIGGEQRGRELGYPTANMSIDGLHPPAFGVYAVLIDVLEGPHAGSYNGVASMGVRPMFGENKPNLETFIFDFKGDLYGTPYLSAWSNICAAKRNSTALKRSSRRWTQTACAHAAFWPHYERPD